eukprot:COSAG02_NODE_76_length_41115_cov_60.967817_18_plen_300_part_00
MQHLARILTSLAQAGPAATARMPSLVDAILHSCTDETWIAITTALPTAADILRFVVTSHAVGQRLYFHRTARFGSSGAVQPENWSIAEEAARRWLSACSEQERSWVPRYDRESWLGLMREVELLRRSAVFGRSHKTAIELCDGGAHVCARRYDSWIEDDDGWFRSAASMVVMRAGRHYAQFTLGDSYPMCGVISPGWSVEEGQRAQHVDGHCFYYAGNGGLFLPADGCIGSTWEGMQSARWGDRIGILLNLDEGSMTVYKNGTRLGVMVSSGLRDEYCWAVVLAEPGESLRIEPAAVPI